MPKRTDIKSILIVGAGPIIIGQACEFDYSGTQACQALKEEGYRIILVNSNPATIMTDPDIADATYIEPITPEILEKVIAAERPDAILPTMGGQTALNVSLALQKSGVLDRYGVEMIGAKAASIEMAEDRAKFSLSMREIGLETPRSGTACNMSEALALVEELGLPVIIRPSFTLGGLGGGIAFNAEEFQKAAQAGIEASPVSQILIEESVLGWKEYEMEVVRDQDDNCIIVCSIENINPMGVHTGDSITVSPALTLTDKEFQRMRNASIAVIRKIGVDTGGSNVQFAVCPDSGRMVVIEMNPRVSRSSALASKATGFPIAKTAARLAVGYRLNEINNEVANSKFPASFEPSIDYIVTKIPKFNFEKFPGSVDELTTSMKSVGEVMAIGRSFKESLQKALRSLETDKSGLDGEVLRKDAGEDAGEDLRSQLRAAISKRTSKQIFLIADAFRAEVSIEEAYEATSIDRWFLRQIKEIVEVEEKIIERGLPTTPNGLRQLKQMGFADARLAVLSGQSEAEVRSLRHKMNIRPNYKRIDTCAAEFESDTDYFYSTYEYESDLLAHDESSASSRRKAIILGGGPNRIGQGIEFDYCCCHGCFALSQSNVESIMINCNPETVSTDYITSDRLYFEPVTFEDVSEIIHIEQGRGELLGLITQFGGQTPLKLVNDLHDHNIPLLGTTADAIDRTEDRERFEQVLDKLQIAKPESAIVHNLDEARSACRELGYPLMIRPSYVLGGRAMEILRNDNDLERYLASALEISGAKPLLIDKFLSNALEVDVDAVSDGTEVYIAGIMEHIEEAGVHSGDSACVLPPYSISADIQAQIAQSTADIARELGVIGMINIQFAVKNNVVYVLEANPRASRSSPFVAKATGVPIIKIATKLMLGSKLADFQLTAPKLKHYAVKEAVFPFHRFAGVDTLLGPEMRSTGEVMGIADNIGLAVAKAYLAAGEKLPRSGSAFISVKDQDKEYIIAGVATLVRLGFKILATTGTAKAIRDAGFEVERVAKVSEQRPHILDFIKDGKIDIVFNTAEDIMAVADSKDLRQAALHSGLPYWTTLPGSLAIINAVDAYSSSELDVRSIQSYFPNHPLDVTN